MIKKLRLRLRFLTRSKPFLSQDRGKARFFETKFFDRGIKARVDGTGRRSGYAAKAKSDAGAVIFFQKPVANAISDSDPYCM